MSFIARFSIIKKLEHLTHLSVPRAYLIRWLLISSFIGLVTGILVWILGKVTSIMLSSIVFPLLGNKIVLIRGINLRLLLELLMLLALGHLLSYTIVVKLCPEAAGSGCDIAFYNYDSRRYLFRLRVPFCKVLATIPTLGLGASVGKEGPAVLIGASSSSLAASLFRLDIRDLKVAYVAGISAGISAALGSPLGGTVFGLEFLRVHDIELEILELLYPSLVASLASYVTLSVLSGSTGPSLIVPLKTMPNMLDPRVILAFVVLGALTGFFSRIYAETYYAVKYLRIMFFARRAILLVILAAVIVSVIGGVAPLAITTGYHWLELLLANYKTLVENSNIRYVIMFLFLIILLKIAAISLTVASGCSGGTIAPSIVLGGYVGTLTFLLLHPLGISINVLPLLVTGGAATLLGSIYRVPISAILIVADMTGIWPATPLFALSMAISYLVTGHWSLYPRYIHVHTHRE